MFYKDHSVLMAMEEKLNQLREAYRDRPSEYTRAKLVQFEQRLAQWTPAPS